MAVFCKMESTKKANLLLFPFLLCVGMPGHAFMECVELNGEFCITDWK